MKNIVIAAAMSVLWVLTGCASAPVDRNYVINSTGYSVSEGQKQQLRAEALENAKANLLDNLQIFMENGIPLSEKMIRNIMYGTTISSEGFKNSSLYAVNLKYTFDLFRFAVDNLSFKDIQTWRLLGLENYYSDYMNANFPLGIWLKKNENAGKRHDPTTLAMLSAIPVYSGLFNLNKPVEGAFFAVLKATGLATMAFHPDTRAKLWSAGALVFVTALDIWAAYTGSNTINQRLKALEDSVTNDGADVKMPVYSAKF